MKTPAELFELTTHGPWFTSGKDVQWKYEIVGATAKEAAYSILAFQCSASKSDWKFNFKFFPKIRRAYKGNSKHWYVHRGFFELWASAKDEICKAVEQMPPKVIVGYSQGAALALLATEEFKYKGFYDFETIVFGCPRVFWKVSPEFRGHFSQTVRCEVKNDLVTKVPFGFLFFSHVGERIKMKSRFIFWSANAHRPSEYREGLKNV